MPENERRGDDFSVPFEDQDLYEQEKQKRLMPRQLLQGMECILRHQFPPGYDSWGRELRVQIFNVAKRGEGFLINVTFPPPKARLPCRGIPLPFNADGYLVAEADDGWPAEFMDGETPIGYFLGATDEVDDEWANWDSETRRRRAPILTLA